MNTTKRPLRIPGPSQPFSSRRSHLSRIEWVSLLAVISDPRDRAMFRVAYSHGLIAMEVAALYPSDVRLRSRTLRLRRRGLNACEVPLLPQEVADLRRWLSIRGRAPGPLFPSRNGGPISRRRLDALMKEYCSFAGIHPEKAFVRNLRRSCAIELLRGHDPWVACDWLGLTNVRNLRRYQAG